MKVFSGSCRPACVIILTCILRTFEAGMETKDMSRLNFIERAKKIADTEIAPYTRLTTLLTSPPQAIALMGHLLLIATGNDFTLKTKSFKNQFEYLKYPDSFRASMVQLTNIEWNAFNEAHISMDSMKLHMKNIDRHLKLLVNVMKEGTNDEVQYFSTKTLKKIGLISDECLKLSLDVEARFLLFMNVTTELLEASTVAKSFYEEKAKDTKMAIRAAKEEVNKSKEEKERLAKRFEEIEEEIKSASEDFKKALDDIPSLIKLMALSIVDGSFGVVNKLLFRRGHSMYDQSHDTRKTESAEDKGKNRAFRFAEDLNLAVDQLVEIATAGSKNGQKEPDWIQIDDVRGLKHTFSYIDKKLKKDSEHTDAHHQGIKIIKNAFECSDKLIELEKR
ncbi:uncharacterized protein LOC134687193 [Mytilus trossulus]|uniref:uncharacterized protein LOC134687193 n=1 Tax=Mytilus trossulus TaxID=6551 RepID=UPI003006F5A2